MEDNNDNRKDMAERVKGCVFVCFCLCVCVCVFVCVSLVVLSVSSFVCDRPIERKREMAKMTFPHIKQHFHKITNTMKCNKIKKFVHTFLIEY